MGRSVFGKIALFGLLVLGLGVGALALYNGGHKFRSGMPAVVSPDPAERPAFAKPRLPAPPLIARNARPEPEPDTRATNLFARLAKGEELPQVTVEQLGPYLAANRRSAGCLLAAFKATGDRSLLQEAKEKYPNDPVVAFTALYKCDSPEERRQWLDALTRASPDNALASYLSANEYLKADRTDDAVRELEAAHGKTKLDDFGLERVQNTEEAYRAAGLSEAEAKGVAMMSLELPQLAQLKQLTQSVLDLASSYRQAGDAGSAQAALQISSELGQRLNTGQTTIIQDLVGMAVEKLALSAMDPAAPYGTAGQTVKDRMDQLTQQRQVIKTLGQSSEDLLRKLPEQEIVSYFDRLKMFGEYRSMQWLTAKYGPQ